MFFLPEHANCAGPPCEHIMYVMYSNKRVYNNKMGLLGFWRAKIKIWLYTAKDSHLNDAWIDVVCESI